jgi:hypothetical protein
MRISGMETLGLGAGAGVGVDLEAEAYDLEVDATALMDRIDGADLRIALSEADMVMRLYSVGHYRTLLDQKDKISYRLFDSVNRV